MKNSIGLVLAGLVIGLVIGRMASPAKSARDDFKWLTVPIDQSDGLEC